MRYVHSSGVIIPFVQKFYKQMIIVVAALFIASIAMMTASTTAVSGAGWAIVPGSVIDFSCGGGSYEHTIDTVVPGAGGDFTGTGHYNPNTGYTWDISGNVTGSSLVFTVVYTGISVGSVYNATNGVIASDGSVSGDVDSNCESFSMVAGSSIYNEAGEITAPSAGEVVSGDVTLAAVYDDGDTTNDDINRWAVRNGTCAAGTNTVFGNVDGHSDASSWDGVDFSAIIDSTTVADGHYCFIFNPLDDNVDVRETREFVIDNTAPETPENLRRVAASDGEVLACGVVTTRQTLYPTWDDNAEAADDFAYYEYSSFNNGTPGIIERDMGDINQFVHSWVPPVDGVFGYQVRSVDTTGNESEWSEICTVVYDSVAPVVTVESPVDGATVVGSVDVYGTVVDDNLKHYNASLYPSTTDLSDGDTHSADRILSNTVVTSEFSNQIVLGFDSALYEDGEYQIRLAARDLAENRDTTDPYNGGTSSVHVITVFFDNYVSNIDECKKGGWERGMFDGEVKTTFRNQGDCVSFFATGGTNPATNGETNESANSNKRR